MSCSLKNWLNKIFEQKFKWRWYACKVKLHESFISEIVLDLQVSGVSICITQITLHNIQVVLVFKQKSWNTNCKQTNLSPVVYNYWHNVLIKYALLKSVNPNATSLAGERKMNYKHSLFESEFFGSIIDIIAIRIFSRRFIPPREKEKEKLNGKQS